MPNLPRIPRTVRRRDRTPQHPAERSEPQVAEISAAGLRWLNIETPTAVETAWLAQHFDFHELDLEDVLSTRQRPKIDEYDEYLFIVLHVPHFNKVRGRLDAAELNVFVGNGFVVTLPNVALKPVGRLFSQLEAYTEVVEALATTNESVIAHKQNDILRILTIFSVILLPLTLITGIFGMNFGHIPFSRDYHGFIVTVGIMFSVAMGLLGYFHWKRWI